MSSPVVPATRGLVCSRSEYRDRYTPETTSSVCAQRSEMLSQTRGNPAGPTFTRVAQHRVSAVTDTQSLLTEDGQLQETKNLNQENN